MLLRSSLSVTCCLLALALAACGDPPGDVPERLAGQPLREALRGDEAHQVVGALHGRGFPGLEHVVASYGPEGSPNTLYVTVYPDEDAARRDLLQMSLRMAPGVPPFAPLETDGMGGHPLFRTEGLGARHTFFRHGTRLVWLQWEPESAAAAEADLLEFTWPETEPQPTP